MPISLTFSQAAQEKLLPSTISNLVLFYGGSKTLPRHREAIDALLEKEAWTELDNRFYRDIAFGTGGMRGRTIGQIIAASEQGTPGLLGQPEFPAVGTNMLNEVNVHRAVSALGLYLREAFPATQPKVVIGHDTRFFSAQFADVAEQALTALGITAIHFLDKQDRSTPQISFTTRNQNAHAGIMITASHNPPHDNGMKFYFADGGQVVEPHASNITKRYSDLAANPQLLEDAVANVSDIASVIVLGETADKTYQDGVASLVLDLPAIEEGRTKVKFVYTPLHGAGIRAIPTLLRRFGFQFSIVAAQSMGDGRFPTVKSPNPENAEALALAIQQAENDKADVVLATDPDNDRMGVAVRDSSGELILLSGNQIGSIIAHYRISTLERQGVLTPENKSHAALVKTFVTTDLQDKIAQHFGIACLNTLTGFKYIGEKMLQYEQATGLENYRLLTSLEQRDATLTKSRFIIFAGEESYGYTGGDYVRDKDGNAAVLMFAEVAAWAASKGLTLVDYLNNIYRQVGFFSEKLGTLTFDGASGAQKIAALLASFRSESPVTFQNTAVTSFHDYGKTDFFDLDGKLIPKETMLIFSMADGSRMAVRGSGTEPKIKFYFFTQAPVDPSATDEALAAIKTTRKQFLDAWWDEVQAMVKQRVG